MKFVNSTTTKEYRQRRKISINVSPFHRYIDRGSTTAKIHFSRIVSNAPLISFDKLLLFLAFQFETVVQIRFLDNLFIGGNVFRAFRLTGDSNDVS